MPVTPTSGFAEPGDSTATLIEKMPPAQLKEFDAKVEILPGIPIEDSDEFVNAINSSVVLEVFPEASRGAVPKKALSTLTTLPGHFARAFAHRGYLPDLTAYLDSNSVKLIIPLESWFQDLQRDSMTNVWRKLAAGPYVVRVYDVLNGQGRWEGLFPPDTLRSLTASAKPFGVQLLFSVITADGESNNQSLFLVIDSTGEVTLLPTTITKGTVRTIDMRGEKVSESSITAARVQAHENIMKGDQQRKQFEQHVARSRTWPRFAILSAVILLAFGGTFWFLRKR